MIGFICAGPAGAAVTRCGGAMTRSIIIPSHSVSPTFRTRSKASMRRGVPDSHYALRFTFYAHAQVTAPLASSRTIPCRNFTPFSKPSRAVMRLSSCSIESTPS